MIFKVRKLIRENADQSQNSKERVQESCSVFCNSQANDGDKFSPLLWCYEIDSFAQSFQELPSIGTNGDQNCVMKSWLLAVLITIYVTAFIAFFAPATMKRRAKYCSLTPTVVVDSLLSFIVV